MADVIEGQRTFTAEEYHRMGEAGVFAPGERLELIRGWSAPQTSSFAVWKAEPAFRYRMP